MDPVSGGPCQGIRNIIPKLYERGISNEVLCLNNPDSNFLKEDTFITHAIGPAFSPWNYTKNLTHWLLNNISRFDILIIHGLWLYHGYAVYNVLNKYKRINNGHGPKLYIMPHGMLDPYFQKATKRKFKSIRNWLYWKFIEAKIINNADGIIFTCQEELNLAKNTFKPYNPQKELNIGYGIPEPPNFNIEFTNELFRKCQIIQNEPYILFLGRIHEKKGVDILIEAYNIAHKYSISKSTKMPMLLIVGPGSDTRYGVKLINRVKQLNLQQKIVFLDMLTGAAKWGAFYGCEAFILPSHQENFGISVVEALACSKPVLISYQVNIWREIIADGGGMAAVDTIEGTLELLNNWNKTSPQNKKEFGKRAKLCYVKNYSIESNLNVFINKLLIK